MKKKIRLWLDDIRDPNKFGYIGWVWAKTYEDAIAYLTRYEVVQASLDHDLTLFQTIGTDDGEKTGYDVVLWMEEHNVFPVNGVNVHSANPAGVKRMVVGLQSLCNRKAVSRQLVTSYMALESGNPRQTF